MRERRAETRQSCHTAWGPWTSSRRRSSSVTQGLFGVTPVPLQQVSQQAVPLG